MLSCWLVDDEWGPRRCYVRAFAGRTFCLSTVGSGPRGYTCSPHFI
jgi:hypothetical protein